MSGIVELLFCFYQGRHTVDNGTCAMCGFLVEDGKGVEAPDEYSAEKARQLAAFFAIE